MTDASPALPDLWLHDRRYDLFWYAVVPVLLWCLCTGASAALGPNGPLLVYLGSAILTGLTHNSLTWLLIMPRDSRKFYEAGALFGPLLLTALVVIPTIVWFGTPAFAIALSINITIAYYHITRQHQGLLHQCDARYVQATGEQAFRAYARDWRWLVGLFAATCFAWKLTGPPMRLGLMHHPVQYSFYPLPWLVAAGLTAATAFVAVRLAVATWQRHRAGKRFATVHFALGGMILANLLAAALVPNASFFLTLALVASFHNLQYFAFCYTHHHLRALASGEEGLYARWARERRWAPWFALPMACGVAFAAATALLPPVANTAVAVWFMTSHYFVDGNVWRRKYYPLMGRFGGGRIAPAAAASATGLAELPAGS